MAREIALLVDGDKERLESLQSAFKTTKQFRVVTASDGRKGLQRAKKWCPSVIVLNADLPELDGLELLRELGDKREDEVRIMLAEGYTAEFSRDARSAGVDHFFTLPVRSRVVFACACGEELPQKPWEIEELARGLLREIGILAEPNAYEFGAHEYLAAALALVNENPHRLDAIEKELYRKVGRQMNASTAGVERAIRHAVGRLWKYGDAAWLSENFGAAIEPGRSRPRNRAFIAVLAKQLEQRVAEWEQVLGGECMER